LPSGVRRPTASRFQLLIDANLERQRGDLLRRGLQLQLSVDLVRRLIYTSGHGRGAFTVPQFDRYLRRNDELAPPAPRR